MKEIIIISSQPDEYLMASLNILFPDCQIHVVFSRTEALEEALSTAEKMTDKLLCSRNQEIDGKSLEDDDKYFRPGPV